MGKRDRYKLQENNFFKIDGVSDVEGNVEMKWIEEDKVSFRGEVEGYDIQVFGKCDQCLSIKTN